MAWACAHRGAGNGGDGRGPGHMRALIVTELSSGMGMCTQGCRQRWRWARAAALVCFNSEPIFGMHLVSVLLGIFCFEHFIDNFFVKLLIIMYLEQSIPHTIKII